MIQFAIQEVHSLVSGLPEKIDDRSPEVRYLCSLFAELAYYHVPQWEIDDKKRAKLIPCEAYKAIVATGKATNVGNALQQLDLPRGFVVVDRGVVAVGLVLNKLLFVGFRGTQFLFDWRLNLRSRLTPISAKVRMRPGSFVSTMSGRFHSGFAKEAQRISTRIVEAVRDCSFGDIDHVFLTGHSLGGAVAAIAENFLGPAPTSVCIFGAPRYADLSAYATLRGDPPTQVRRPGDVVPTVPPKTFGYIDHPYEFATNGSSYVDPVAYSSSFGGLARWAQFLLGRFEPHSMENYRKELGITAGARGALSALVPVEKITLANIESS